MNLFLENFLRKNNLVYIHMNVLQYITSGMSTKSQNGSIGNYTDYGGDSLFSAVGIRRGGGTGEVSKYYLVYDG